MYLTYADYKGLGGKIEEKEYKAYERAARRKIDHYTHNRVRELEEAPKEVKECVYDLINYLYSLADAGDKEIERERTDTYEVYYSISRKRDLKEDKVKSIVKENLTHTGLLYRGIG